MQCELHFLRGIDSEFDILSKLGVLWNQGFRVVRLWLDFVGQVKYGNGPRHSCGLCEVLNSKSWFHVGFVDEFRGVLNASWGLEWPDAVWIQLVVALVHGGLLVTVMRWNWDQLVAGHQNQGFLVSSLKKFDACEGKAWLWCGAAVPFGFGVWKNIYFLRVYQLGSVSFGLNNKGKNFSVVF